MADMSVVALGAVVGYVVVSYIQKTKAQSDAGKIATLLLGNPEVAAWLEQNLTGNNVADIKAIRLQFGLGLLEAKALLDKYRAR